MQHKPDEPQDGRTRSRLVMVGLFAMFIAPIGVAWLFSAGFLDLGDYLRTNRGELLEPAIDLREEQDLVELFRRAGLEPGQWLVAYLGGEECAENCAQVTAKLLTIRSLLGYSGQRVQILGVAAQPLDASQNAQATHLLIDAKSYSALRSAFRGRGIDLGSPVVFLLDWRKQLVVSFPHDADPIDIKKDLKRLLRASKIR